MATIQPIVQPNLFELQGYKTQITYSTTSIIGVPQLTYISQGKTLNFKGEEIHSEQTQLGQMVTVSISDNPSSEILETLTLLIPVVNLQPTTLEQAMQTIAIFSRIIKSTKAQVQTYATTSLSGKAQQVAF